MSILEKLRKGVVEVFKKEVKVSLESQQNLSDLEVFIEKAESVEELFRAEILQNISKKIEDGRAEGDLENHKFIVYISEKEFNTRGESRRNKLKKSLEEKCNSHARKLISSYSIEPPKIEINIGYDENLSFNTENQTRLNHKSRFSNLFKVVIANDAQSNYQSQEIIPIVKSNVRTFQNNIKEDEKFNKHVVINDEIETEVKDNDATILVDDDATVIETENKANQHNYYLEVFNGEELIETYEINKQIIKIGRAAKDTYLTQADIILNNKSISRDHAELIIDGEYIWLKHKGKLPTTIESIKCKPLAETIVKLNQQIQIQGFTIVVKQKQ